MVTGVRATHLRVYEHSAPQQIDAPSVSASETEQVSSSSIQASYTYENALGLFINMHFLSVALHFVKEGFVQAKINPEDFINILENCTMDSDTEKMFSKGQRLELSRVIFNGKWLNRALAQENQYPKEIRAYLHHTVQTHMDVYLSKKCQAESSSAGSRGTSISCGEIIDFYRSVQSDLFCPLEEYFSLCAKLEEERIQKSVEEYTLGQRNRFSQQIYEAKGNLRHVPKEEIVERHYVEMDCTDEDCIIKIAGAPAKRIKIYAKDLIEALSCTENAINHFMLFRGEGDITQKIAAVARGTLSTKLPTFSLRHAGVLPFIDIADLRSFVNDFTAFRYASAYIPPPRIQPVLPTFQEDPSLPSELN